MSRALEGKDTRYAFIQKDLKSANGRGGRGKVDGRLGKQAQLDTCYSDKTRNA
eukprot:CAMPEP_0198357140 /NCGR_PEP_ID=MMETSP1450-20131203/125598_1 /TAXON_ID=753684 ORGANISM="Madagascaria erythrocladiodes, Strain CCMP3234" /NCGR_SAMPLE_ID=MMETSP1450 /ASSEMBLY_ACC=CAM_ASM_001115 /LENGTH=52 /DNA_ID=CAMNT_0044063725 /DNA_START=128 /DNA_END=289 /DNA_ORIENTATION=-